MFCKCWLRWMSFIAVLLLPLPLFARPLIVVLPFDGAPQARQTVIRLLRERYEVAARLRLGTENGPVPSRVAQTDVGQKPPDVVVSGAMQQTNTAGKWSLLLSFFHGPSGQRVTELRHGLAQPILRKGDAQELAQELFPAIERVISWSPQNESPVAPTPAPIPASRINLPYFEADAGFIIGLRRFGFDEEAVPSEVRCYERVLPAPSLMTQGRALRYSSLPRCAGFNLSAAPGLRLNLALFPLARLSAVSVRGLGIGITFDWMFWPTSPICDRAPDGSCSPQGADRAIREYRLEAGLRWRWPLPRPWPSPSLTVQYGLHHFSIQPSDVTYALRSAQEVKATTVTVTDNHGLPDLRYQYLDLGIGMKALYFEREHLSVGGEMDFHYHVMFSHGEIEKTFTDDNFLQGGYGPIRKSQGWRLGATPVQLRWRARNTGVPGWLRAELAGYVEKFRMQFQMGSGDEGNSLPPIRREPEQGAKYLSQGANDWYFGLVAQVGYEY